MKKVIEILMKRDGLSKTEAVELVLEVRERIYYCNSDIEAEEILLEDLGLEPDYLFDIL